MGILATQGARNGGRDVVRTVWLTGLCLAVVGGSFATKVVSAPGPEAVEAADHATKSRTDPLQDTLTKTDKFVVVYVVQSAEDSPSPSTGSEAAQPEPIKPKPGTAIVGRDRPASLAKKVAVLLPRPRSMIKLAKNGSGIDRSKAAPEMKTCRQHDAIAGFLVSAGIAPRCET